MLRPMARLTLVSMRMGSVVALCADLAGEAQAVVRLLHHHVEDQQVGLALLELLQAVGAVGGARRPRSPRSRGRSGRPRPCPGRRPRSGSWAPRTPSLRFRSPWRGRAARHRGPSTLSSRRRADGRPGRAGTGEKRRSVLAAHSTGSTFDLASAAHVSNASRPLVQGSRASAVSIAHLRTGAKPGLCATRRRRSARPAGTSARVRAAAPPRRRRRPRARARAPSRPAARRAA